MLVDLDPYIIRFGGEFGIRWYGFFMALSMGIGLWFLIRKGTRQGYKEDFLYNLMFVVLLTSIAGARLVYVFTNWGDYAAAPAEILRIDHGGLSWHGGIGGGLLAGWLMLRRRPRADFRRLADLTVPGLAVGYMLVRIGNIFNQEVLGIEGALLPFGRHPAQLYGSAIGLILLLLYFYQARRNPPPGYQFWSFFFWYSILRGAVEETFRSNPHYLIDYTNTDWGFGFMTMTHLATPVFVLVSYWLMRAAVRAGQGEAGGKAV